MIALVVAALILAGLITLALWRYAGRGWKPYVWKPLPKTSLMLWPTGPWPAMDTSVIELYRHAGPVFHVRATHD